MFIKKKKKRAFPLLLFVGARVWVTGALCTCDYKYLCAQVGSFLVYFRLRFSFYLYSGRVRSFRD